MTPAPGARWANLSGKAGASRQSSYIRGMTTDPRALLYRQLDPAQAQAITREALARCDATPGCRETIPCAEACQGQSECRVRCREAQPNAWLVYATLEGCNDAQCGRPDQCGLIGFGCGITDLTRSVQGDTPCARCLEGNCCERGLACSQSYACLLFLDCVFKCFGREPGCPAQGCDQVFPDGVALANAWSSCLPTCDPECAR